MEQNKFRCHYSVVFENFGRGFWVLFIGLVSQIDEMSDMIQEVMDGKIEIWEAVSAFGFLLAVFLIYLLYQNIIWAKTWISIEDNAVVIEKRTINRKKNVIGMKNISNINLEQNIFERMMNTYKIKLDTNSKTTADTTDVKIVLSKEKAEWFRRKVMEHMQESFALEGMKEEMQPEDYDVAYSAKDIVMHCVYTASVSSVIILLAMTIGLIVAVRSFHIGGFIVKNFIQALGSIIILGGVFFSVIWNLVNDFFTYYDFRAKRKGNRIYLSYGLLKQRKYVLAVDKINAVEVVSPLIARLFGRQYVKLICIGVGDEKNENSMLLFAETKEEMLKKLSVLLPEFQLEEGNFHKRSRLSIFSEIPKKVLYFAVLAALMILFGYKNLLEIPVLWGRYLVYAVGIFLMLISLVNCFLSFYTDGIMLGKNEFIIVNGCYSRNVTWIPYQKIQQIEYHQGPVRRHFGLATGVVHILAGSVDSVHMATFVEKELYEQVGERILGK